MAIKASKYADNAVGRFYVDESCIDCDLCRQTAPQNFMRNEERGYSYLSKQPGTAEEIVQCEKALSECPVEAIGNDGDI